MDKKNAQTLIEYALILAIITCVAVMVLSFLSSRVFDDPQQLQKNPEEIIEFVP